MRVRRTVVTGAGAVTPVGGTVEETWAALRAGANGAGPITEAWAGALPVRIAARADDAFAEGLSVPERRARDRVEQLTLVAGREAWASAGLPEVDPARVGVSVGTAHGGIATTVAMQDVLGTAGYRRVSPHTITMAMANGPAAYLSLALRAKAGARAPVSACAAGVEAIAQGRDLIRSGAADVVVCGGAEASIVPLSLTGFGRVRALSTRNEEPLRASRPFDADRDGFVMGEGAVLFVLESEEHARARGATVLGVVEGASLTSDAFDIVGGDPVNQARTITLALRDADLDPGDVGLVHAHATSTPAGDVTEARALRAALGSPPAVTATKASTGHLLGASGALGALVALLALRDGVVPPTLNLDSIDPGVDLDVVTTPRPTAARHALVDAFGFGGHSAALALSRD
ncbi:beta-ketoacyl-[acyl-carrier-protein] synthase family protein [Isoptericola sp. NPDC019693]|uniref:beta-ketoacyl-[acyl-carrier-protein] synthase family protein n=1 Tax=Isoptericola sp. NPDC019693 TaxID=3364009 RepID=UPI0037B4D8B4